MKRITGLCIVVLLFVLSANFVYGESVVDMQGNSFPSGTIATASSGVDSYIPANVIDKDLNTRWNADTYQATLQLDFPTELNISALQLAAVATPTTDVEYTVFGFKDGEWTQISEPTIRNVLASDQGVPVILGPIPVIPSNYDAIKINIDGHNSWAAINEITYINQTLNAPHIEKIVDGSIRLYWNSVPGATQYEVKRSETPGGPYTNIAIVQEQPWLGYTDNEASSEDNFYKSYYYVVTASNELETSLNSNEISLIRPSTPLHVQAVAGDKEAKVTWDKVDNATTYKIYVATSEEGPYQFFGYSIDNKVIVNKLINGTKYYIKVTACNDDGYSRYSSPVSVIPEIQENEAPTITSVSPNNGVLAGGNTVYIEGTKFAEGVKVYINDVIANTVFVSGNRLRIVVPSSLVPGFVNVKVINPDLQSVEMQNGYKYNVPSNDPAPTITSISPKSGLLAGGGYAYIDGTGSKSGATISFDGKIISTTYVSQYRLKFQVPAGTKLGVVEVFVINPDGQQSSSVNYEYVAPTPDPAPTITSISPKSGLLAGGGFVYVDGTGSKSGATISFDGKIISTTYVSQYRLKFQVPAGTKLGVVEVFVINPDGQQSSSVNYEYVAPTPDPAPTITSISPKSGLLAGGGFVYVDGTGYKSGATINFGGIVVSTTYVNASRLKVQVPAGTKLGVVEVFVINPDGQQSSSVNYEYVAPTPDPVPTITSLTSTSGLLAGGGYIYLDGTGYKSGATINFGGKIVSTTYVSQYRLKVQVPAGTKLGVVEVFVINPDGQQSSSVNYEYK